MEPRIHYARTSDGVSIAYTVTGIGPTVIDMPSQPLSHQLLNREAFPESYADMGRWFRTVTYDVRGAGMSDRGAADFSLEAMLRDLDAVVHAEAPESFTLSATWDSVPVAIAYASRHPDRVSHLVLAEGWMSFGDYEQGQALEIERALREKDWKLNSETMARVLLGFEGDEAVRYAEFFRACVDKATWKASQEAIECYDVRPFIDAVEAQTLVIHNQHNRWLPVEVSHRLAAHIRRSQLVIVEDNLHKGKGFFAMLRDFMGIEPTPAADIGVAAHASVRTVLFTDIVGHTEMMQRLGDAKGRDVLREHERITRDLLRSHGGAEVKTMGDGFLASFGSVTQAMECAIALQRAFAAWNDGDGAASGEDGAGSGEDGAKATSLHGASLQVRVGLNAGEPIEEDGDLFGSTVILASRIAAKAGAGEILVPDTVRGLLSGKQFLFSDRGEFVPKGFHDAVRVYEVRWRPGVAAGDEPE